MGKRSWSNAWKDQRTSIRKWTRRLTIKAEHMAKYVHRYQPDSDNRRESLVNDKIWLCSPDQYNDPLPGSQDRERYSVRNVSAGSICATRSAGTKLAVTAMTANSNGTATSVNGSYKRTPYN